MQAARMTYAAAALELHHESPTSPIFLAGFSLGGNIVLKLAGEAAIEPVPGLAQSPRSPRPSIWSAAPS